MESTPTPAGPARVPRSVRVAAAIVALEAVALVGIGGWMGVSAIRESSPTGLPIALSTAGFVLAVGIGMVFATYGVIRCRRWVRGPVVVVQLLVLPLGLEFAGPPTTPVGVTMIAAAIAVLVLLFRRTSSAAFEADEETGEGRTL